jgi:hypothetical protein
MHISDAASPMGTPDARAMDVNPWLTVRQYARRHGVTTRTVWLWVSKGIAEASRKARRTHVRVRNAVSSEIK